MVKSLRNLSLYMEFVVNSRQVGRRLRNDGNLDDW